MRFHARLAPGVVVDPEQVVDLIVHSPAACDDVTIKLWELDSFRDPETGERRHEGTQDDLLAEFVGRLEPGDPDRASPGWRRFVVTSQRIVSDDPDLVRVRLRLCGAEEVHEVPIVSEAGEAEGASYELGLSIEHAGEERYRTTVPCLFSPPTVHPVLIRRRVAGRLDDGAADPDWTSEGRLSLAYVAFGVGEGEPGRERLHVLLRGHVDVHGQLVRRPDDEGAPGPIALRAGRPLFAYVHDDPDAVPLGPTRIPLAVCDPLDAAGRVVREESALLDRGSLFTLDDLLRAGAPGGGAELAAEEARQLASRRPRPPGSPLVGLLDQLLGRGGGA